MQQSVFYLLSEKQTKTALQKNADSLELTSTEPEYTSQNQKMSYLFTKA